MRPVVVALRVSAIACVLWIAWACGQSLPEPESEAAQLYVAYCSGSGCHGPIPPQGSPPKYWEVQYERMLLTMQQSARPLPTAEQDAIILDYLRRNALQ